MSFWRCGVVGTLMAIWGAVCLLGCDAKRGSNGFTDGESIKLSQYMIEGQKLYEAHCGNCHQADGKGLGNLFPPINNSDYLRDNFEESLCIIKHGKSGEIVVNGVTYNQPMPANPRLTNLEIAEIATYIYNKWEEKRGLVDVKMASKILKGCPPSE